jgi:hypothetical protein
LKLKLPNVEEVAFVPSAVEGGYLCKLYVAGNCVPDIGTLVGFIDAYRVPIPPIFNNDSANDHVVELSGVRLNSKIALPSSYGINDSIALLL